MSTKQEAEIKITKAEKMCADVHEASSAAVYALSRQASVNGYGIYHDRFLIRNKLQEAQGHIQQALKTLEEIEWPTDADYDQC
jgi:hypothetical protein